MKRRDPGLVKLKLDLTLFDDGPFRGYVERCEQEGIEFATMSTLGDTDNARRKLYELNRECSRDIPGRGVFYTYDEYVTARIAVPAYSPAAIVVALDEQEWVGMSAMSDWRSEGFMFNEMTGVRASHRGRGIAMAMRVSGIRYAQSTGARWLSTIHDPRNVEAIEMNRRLGYVESEWEGSRPR